MARTYSTDEVMAMMQAPREDVQMLDKPASPFLDPAQINAAERELSDDPNFFVDQTPAPQRPDGGNAALYPSKQETQPSLPKPVYSTDEVMALYTNESKPVYSTKDVMKQMIAPLYDPTAPRPSRDEYFKLKDMEKSLKESGDIEDPGAFEIGARAVGGLLVTAADALATATFKVDPKDALFTVGGIGVNPSKAIDDTLKRKDATVRLAGEFVKQQYNAMSEGLAAIGGPKYRVKETGEFITSMQQGLDAAKMGQAGGMGGVPAADDSALIERYKKQGLTLAPVGEDDLKDWEYLQWSKKMDRNMAIEQAATSPRPPDVLYRLAAGLKPSIADYMTGRADYAEAVAPVLANESQANVLSMAIDPMMWATSGAGATTRLGISAAAKGATAETLGILGMIAQKAVKPTEQALTKAEAFKKLIVSPAKVASAYGAASGVAWAADKLELPSELKSAAFTAASLYGAYKAGLGVLRFTANKLPEASVILRESANATNGFDAAARKAVAANADVPFSIRERLLRPGQFVAMESTPARLAKNMELSPGTRAMMDKLSNWYVVQGVRGASAVATGAVKGAAAGVPFAELMRSAGDDESAAAIYGMGAAFGSAGGAAERALGARGRRYAQAESDIARFLTDVQGNTTGLKDVKRYNWIDTEVGRMLTDVELGAGDVSSLVKNRSFDELARTAAMQGFFRDRVDFVPLGAADFALNAKGHGADGSAGYFLNAPDGQRPRIFVNVEARRADVEPHEFYEAFFSSDAFSPEQKASMRAAVDNRYGADGLMARGREYAESLIKAENAKNFPNENLFVTSEQIAAKMDQLAQDELGRGGQDALDWVRREVMVEEARMAGIDYAAMRRNVPAGQNPITFIENLLGANARALGLSGVRVDPETGMAITPEQLFKENPVAANDPKLVKQLNGYLKTYKQWLNDPQHETPKGTRIAPDGRAESLANNPNVKFYDGVNGKENSIAFVDASGRVIEKTPKQRAKERKLRGQQIRNMVGSKILEPGNTTFGLKRWADGRIRAGGKRLPDVMALQTHWKAHLPVIRSIEALSDAGESQQVLYFAKGNSADKVKSSRLSDIDAINREMVFDQWTTNAAGDLLAQFLDLTSVRNRAMKAIAERHPALDPANGGPGYKLQAIMDDVNQWMADKGAGKAGEATIGVPRKNVVNALINPGTNFNRGRNDLAGAFGRGSAIKTLLLENINAVSGTGRKGAAMDYAWANGNFMPDKPAPRPDMDGDLAPPRPQMMADKAPDVAEAGDQGVAMPKGTVTQLTNTARKALPRLPQGAKSVPKLVIKRIEKSDIVVDGGNPKSWKDYADQHLMPLPNIKLDKVKGVSFSKQDIYDVAQTDRARAQANAQQSVKAAAMAAADPLKFVDPVGYSEIMRASGVVGDILIPPSGLKLMLTDPSAFVGLLDGGFHGKRTVPGTRAAALQGLDGVSEMRQLVGGQPSSFNTALHHFWGTLSKQLDVINQEAAWMRLVLDPAIIDAIDMSIAGKFSMQPKAWEALVAKALDGTQGDFRGKGNNAKSNANSFYKALVYHNGRWDEVAALYANNNAIDMRAQFNALGHGKVGMKNKVQGFVGLSFGIKGSVLDRWRFVDLYLPDVMSLTGASTPEQYFKYVGAQKVIPQDPIGIYKNYGTLENSNPAFSLALYNSLDSVAQVAINNSPKLRNYLGAHADPGGLHWVTWNSIKNEAVGHSSLDITKNFVRQYGRNGSASDFAKFMRTAEGFVEGSNDAGRITRISLKNGVFSYSEQ